MTQQCILIREEGHAIPASVLEPIIANHKRYMSVAFGDGKQVRIISQPSEKVSISLETVQGSDVKIKDKNAVWVFGDGPEMLNTGDQQPFTLLKNDEGKPVLVAFADGEFDGSFQKAIDDEIRPRVERAWRASQKDLVKLMEDEMTDPIMGRDIVNTMLGKRGSIVVLSADGVSVRFVTKDDKTCSDFDGGWVSNSCSITEEQVDLFTAAVSSAAGASDETKSAAEPKAAGGGLRRSSAPARRYR